MKKTLLFLACTLLLALTMTATVGAYAFVPGSDAVVYVDGTAGSDANNGATPAAAVATPQKAQSLLPNGGTVVVSGEAALTAAYDPAAVKGAVLYTSVYGGTDYRKSGAKLSVGGNMAFSNDTYFDNIDLAITKTTLVFSGKFHNFGFGAGVSCTQAATATTFYDNDSRICPPRHTGRSKLRCGFHADHRGRHVAQLLRRQPPHGCLAGARQGLRRQLYPH